MSWYMPSPRLKEGYYVFVLRVWSCPKKNDIPFFNTCRDLLKEVKKMEVKTCWRTWMAAKFILIMHSRASQTYCRLREAATPKGHPKGSINQFNLERRLGWSFLNLIASDSDLVVWIEQLSAHFEIWLRILSENRIVVIRYQTLKLNMVFSFFIK